MAVISLERRDLNMPSIVPFVSARPDEARRSLLRAPVKHPNMPEGNQPAAQAAVSVDSSSFFELPRSG
jgi:hypothetical protein